LTTLVVRCCLGRLARRSEAVGGQCRRLGLLQSRHDGAHVAMPICGLLRGSPGCRWPIPARRGFPRRPRLDACRLDALQHFKGAVIAEVDLVHTLEWSVMPRRSPTSCSVTPAPRVADSHPPKRRSLCGRGRGGRRWFRPARPLSSERQGNRRWGRRWNQLEGDLWATVIMTCCSLALGRAKLARACCRDSCGKARCLIEALAAQGRDAGRTISFFSPGPLGPVIGSRVCSGSERCPRKRRCATHLA